MIKIRPHHILCMKAYRGKGYSKDFNKNMQMIINDLKKDFQQVEVTFGLDCICSHCPNNDNDKICTSEEKVSKIDLKVSKHFKIKEGIYQYSDLKEKVYLHITEEIFEDICSDCEWYGIMNCKELIIESK